VVHIHLHADQCVALTSYGAILEVFSIFASKASIDYHGVGNMAQVLARLVSMLDFRIVGDDHRDLTNSYSILWPYPVSGFIRSFRAKDCNPPAYIQV